MPKGIRNRDDNPSFVITARMNPELSEAEAQAWEIWQSIDRRTVIKQGFTSKAELLATALIQYINGQPESRDGNVERLLKQILSKLNSGGFIQAPAFTQNETDVLIDFAQNRQMLDDLIGDNQ